MRIYLLYVGILISPFFACRSNFRAALNSASDANESSSLFNAADVSILFPKDASSNIPYPGLTAAYQADGQDPLLSEAIYRDIFRYSQSINLEVTEDMKQRVSLPLHRGNKLVSRLPADIPREKWFVHGLRVDDCGPPSEYFGKLSDLRATNLCHVQIRLILHPVMNEDELGNVVGLGFGESDDRRARYSVGTPDYAMHLIYDLGARDIPIDVLNDLSKIKALSPVSTDPIKLGGTPRSDQ